VLSLHHRNLPQHGEICIIVTAAYTDGSRSIDYMRVYVYGWCGVVLLVCPGTEERQDTLLPLLVILDLRQKKVKTFLRSRRMGGRQSPKNQSHTQVSLCLYHGYAFVVV